MSRRKRWRTIDASGAPEEGAAVAEREMGGISVDFGGWVGEIVTDDVRIA